MQGAHIRFHNFVETHGPRDPLATPARLAGAKLNPGGLNDLRGCGCCGVRCSHITRAQENFKCSAQSNSIFRLPALEGYSEARNTRTPRKLVYFVVMISTP